MAYSLISWKEKMGARDVVGFVCGVSTGRNMGPVAGRGGSPQNLLPREAHASIYQLCAPSCTQGGPSKHYLNWIECNPSYQNS